MEIPEYGLIVVGGGPAGTACAITASRSGVSVLLLEKDKLPRHKVCGEFVSPESLRLLGSLVGETRFASNPEIVSARIFYGPKTICLPIEPFARSIPRFDLDAALLQAARDSGVHVVERAAVHDVLPGKLFQVQTSAAPVEKTFTARSVVNASGRWSQLTQFPHNEEKWIGLKAHFTEAAPPDSVDLYFFDGGYCGVQAITANAINASAMVRSDLAHSLEEVFSKNSELWRRSRDWEPLFAPIATSPLYFRRPETNNKGMFLVGDSAGFIDPFAGDGISLALHSGGLAAQSVVEFLQGKRSLEQAHQQYQTAYSKHLAPAFRNAARIRKLLSAPRFLRSTLLSIAAIKPFSSALVRRTRVKSNQARDISHEFTRINTN
ncbi:MAG TPA: NAD(P)/FAD-dependent oxidoreductase [Candidatus Angelobacter sp.]|nr:NAD(P)/FAD-dependent oxidoreductase [Candidatus Angelobacter sp.]